MKMVAAIALLTYLFDIGASTRGYRLKSKYPPAKPGALGYEPLEAAVWGR